MATMRAVRIHAFGGPDVLDLDELAVPSPAEDEVLIRVHAASINPVDYKIRSGKYQAFSADQLPQVLGRDIAGTIEQCGANVGNVKEWQNGDEVYALLDAAHGGYQEYLTLAAQLCARKPRNLSFVEAAAVPLAALTAYQGLFEHGQLQSEQAVLIHGGAGGVGHFAIQLAKARGATVITTVSSRDVEFVRQLGADQIIPYESESFEDRVLEVDLVLDLVGGETQAHSFHVLKRGGALLSTVGTPDEKQASELGIRVGGYLTVPNATQLNEITALIEAGKVRPHVREVYPLEEARYAQGQAERKHSQGKIVLQMPVSH